MCVYLDIVEKKVIKMALYFMLVKKKKSKYFKETPLEVKGR